VTELVARPLLSLWWPELTGVVQPLAGEWAARRELMESLPIPVGYGVAGLARRPPGREDVRR
jgi:glucosyl-3-phosphoglycerate synthase